MSDALLSLSTPSKPSNANIEKFSQSNIGHTKMYDSMNTKNEWETIHSEKSDVAIYLRVSTDEQNVDSQFLMVDGLLSQHGLDRSKVRIFQDDGISATKMGNLQDRPKGSELIQAIQNGEVKKLFAFKVDRMFRDIEAGSAFVKMITKSYPEVEIITTDVPVPLNTPDGEFLFGLMVLMARREAATLAVRTEAGMDARREQLRPTSHAVYGWDIVLDDDGLKTMIPNWRQQDVMDWVIKQDKKDSHPKIARQLNDWGIPTSTGRKFSAGTVRRMVKTPPKQQEMLHIFDRPERKSKPPFRSLSVTQK